MLDDEGGHIDRDPCGQKGPDGLFDALLFVGGQCEAPKASNKSHHHLILLHGLALLHFDGGDGAIRG